MRYQIRKAMGGYRALGHFTKYMDYYKKTIFKKRIRISDKHLKWIKKNKGQKTSARFLSDIIEKKIKNEKNSKSLEDNKL